MDWPPRRPALFVWIVELDDSRKHHIYCFSSQHEAGLVYWYRTTEVLLRQGSPKASEVGITVRLLPRNRIYTSDVGTPFSDYGQRMKYLISLPCTTSKSMWCPLIFHDPDICWPSFPTFLLGLDKCFLTLHSQALVHEFASACRRDTSCCGL